MGALQALARLLSNKDEAQQQEEEEEEDEGPLWFTSLDFFKPLTFRSVTTRGKLIRAPSLKVPA